MVMMGDRNHYLLVQVSIQRHSNAKKLTEISACSTTTLENVVINVDYNFVQNGTISAISERSFPVLYDGGFRLAYIFSLLIVKCVPGQTF